MALFCCFFSLKICGASEHIWRKQTRFKKGWKKMPSFTSTVSDWSACAICFDTYAEISFTMSGLTLFLVSISTSVAPASLHTICTPPVLAGCVLRITNEQVATGVLQSFPSASLWCFWTTRRNCWKINVAFVWMRRSEEWPNGWNKLGAKDKWINVGYVSVSSMFMSNMHKLFCCV